MLISVLVKVSLSCFNEPEEAPLSLWCTGGARLVPGHLHWPEQIVAKPIITLARGLVARKVGLFLSCVFVVELALGCTSAAGPPQLTRPAIG